MDEKLQKKLKNYIKDNPVTLSELSSKFGISKNKLKKEIRDIKKQGVYIAEQKEYHKPTKYYIPLKLPQQKPLKVDTDYFALTSDWHIGSKYAEEECLLDYLDTIKDYGIKDVFVGGDILDGVNVYQGQVNDLLPDCVNLQGQIERADKLIKKDNNLKKVLISGNHDLRNYQKQGIDPVKLLTDSRKDMEYLGQYYGRAKLKDDLVLELVHPSGSAPYSKDYRIMTYLRERPIDTYPDILGVGHLHTALYRDYQGTNSYLLGSFMGDTDFTRRKGLSGTVGGWVVELDVEDGQIKKIKNELVKY